jgi:hypothetical protein
MDFNKTKQDLTAICEAFDKGLNISGIDNMGIIRDAAYIIKNTIREIDKEIAELAKKDKE